jgi:osmoprotectant transport system ATP-binding protein
MKGDAAEIVRFENVAKWYPGATEAALTTCNFDVRRGEIIAFLGESGSGKTTILKLINRLLDPTAGRILVESQDVATCDPTALRRRVGYVIQSVGLFPHMTVERNVAVVPELLKWPRARIRRRVEELLSLTNLPPERYARRYPFQLSGGERQRVGLARALAGEPPLLLLDEPFGAIDPVNRAGLQATLLTLRRSIGFTAVMVTHDVNEAFALADRIAVMRRGKILQFDEPFRIAAAPNQEYVGELIGAESVLRRLSLIEIGRIMSPAAAPPVSLCVDARMSASRALERMLESGCLVADVTEENGCVGRVSLDDIRRFCIESADAEKDVSPR